MGQVPARDPAVLHDALPREPAALQQVRGVAVVTPLWRRAVTRLRGAVCDPLAVARSYDFFIRGEEIVSGAQACARVPRVLLS